VSNRKGKRRGHRIARPVRLLRALLDGETLNRQRVAELLDIEVAAAAAYLKVLASEFPGIRKLGRGAIRLDRTALQEQVTFPTAVAACLASGFAQLFRGTDYERGLRNAVAFILRNTPRQVQYLPRKFLFLSKGGDPSLPEAGGALADIIDAVLHQRPVTLKYQKFEGAFDEAKIEPLSIVVFEHQLYVLGRLRDGRLHPYRFSRIREVVEGEKQKQFEYPDKNQYDPEQLFRNSFGIFIGNGPVETVQVRLARRWETYARTHRWHPSQRVVLEDDGVRLSLEVRYTPELVTWVLGFGADAEVLSPDQLRDEVAEHARLMVAKYPRRRAHPIRGRRGDLP
jgi:predicted DNA-binding transcriptional regulator YafY